MNSQAKTKVLVVDDDVLITHTLKKFLEGTGKYEVRVENQSIAAVEVARKFTPDLMILDVHMPDLEGGELAALLREDRVLKETPIVFLTSLVQPREVRQSGGVIGGFPFIAKPLVPKVVIDTIETVLEDRQAPIG